jgi:hypothetical protein
VTWRTWAIIDAASGALGFWAGLTWRHPAPAELTAKTVDRVVYKDRIEYRNRVEVQQARAQIIRRVIHVTVAPDGTTTRDVTIDKATNASQTATVTAQGTQAVTVAQSHETVVRVVQRAPWQLGGMGGVNAGAVIGADRRWWAGGFGSHSFVWGSRLGLAVMKKQGEGTDVGIVAEVEF